MQLYDIVWTWMPWVEFAILILIMLSHVMQSHVVTDKLAAAALVTLSVLLAVKGVWQTDISVRLASFGQVCAGVIGVGLIKTGMDYVLNIIFRFATSVSAYWTYKNQLMQRICIALFVYVLLASFLPNAMLWIIPCAIYAAYVCTLFWKLTRWAGISGSHLCYITLYILHAEILPIGLVTAGSYYLLNMQR